ncbi:MAG: YbhB/YbcL family Raf kinase inhibitor-like protein [Spirulina sp. SIO3F2]|nr:YbhB/YbcL family Raf kinase inhibitor-like protein [Spirulina sp. SIO3F2]
MIKLTRILCLLSLVGLLTACDRPELTPQTNVDLRLRSDAFEQNGEIPKQYTCDGADISPPLHWGKPPNNTQSYVLIVDDPDAPLKTWVHWVVYNLPETQNALPEKDVLSDATQGINDFKTVAYGGPCPPKGEHRYFFKLYALDTVLDLPPEAKKADVEKAMQGHVLATGELVGRYTRSSQ